MTDNKCHLLTGSSSHIETRTDLQSVITTRKPDVRLDNASQNKSVKMTDAMDNYSDDGCSQNSVNNLAKVMQATGSDNSKVKRSTISVKVSPKSKMIPKMKSPRSKRYKKLFEKTKSNDIMDKKMSIKRDKISAAVKVNKILETFDDNEIVKRADLKDTDDEDKKDAFAIMMGNSSNKDWGENRTKSPRFKKLKRIEKTKSKSHTLQGSLKSWIQTEKK